MVKGKLKTARSSKSFVGENGNKGDQAIRNETHKKKDIVGKGSEASKRITRSRRKGLEGIWEGPRKYFQPQ